MMFVVAVVGDVLVDNKGSINGDGGGDGDINLSKWCDLPSTNGKRHLWLKFVCKY